MEFEQEKVCDVYNEIATRFDQTRGYGWPWIKEFMSKSEIYIIRPDRHIFGSTSDKITFSELTRDLKEKLGM